VRLRVRVTKKDERKREFKGGVEMTEWEWK
jgi:hypothetical protein